MKSIVTVFVVMALAGCGGESTIQSTVGHCALGPAVAVATEPAKAPSTPGEPFQPVLVTPSGIRPIGTVSLHLVDQQRQDEWIASHPKRELMISLWYPAVDVAGKPLAAYTSPAVWDLDQQADDLPPGPIKAPATHAHEGASVDNRHGALPLILYSPGSATGRAVNTMVVEELASRGYIVATIDHTYDAVAVEFPGGRIEQRSLPDKPEDYAPIIEVRAQDARFVLNALTLLQSGVNPDAEKRVLPANLIGAFDLKRVGMFGASIGGSTTMTAMLLDPRIKAGLSLDSQPYGSVIQQGLDRPFMMINAKANRALLPTLATFWTNLRNWRLEIRMSGAGHVAYSDYAMTAPQMAPVLGMGPKDVEEILGTVDPLRAVTVQRAYPLAFFDRYLRGADCNALLDGPSSLFPEVTVAR
jgi:Platelet-activating factor acetylhydrolase, isoform II